MAGLGFRRWGDITGSGPVEALRARVAPLPPPTTLRTKTDLALAQTLRRAHPLFAPTVLLFLQVRLRVDLLPALRFLLYADSGFAHLEFFSFPIH